MSLFDTIMDGSPALGDENVNTNNDGNPSHSEHGDHGSNPEPSWWWDKSTPGSGDRPDWLPDKYKSAEDVAKAYTELQKKLGSAPDKYDWSKGDGWIDLDYEPFGEMEEYLRGKNVPQDALDVMLGTVDKYLNEFSINTEEEKTLLGDNAKERLMVLNNWAKANFSDDTYQAITGNMRTASAVKAIEEMRAKMIENNTTIPTGNETVQPTYTIEDVTREMQENLQKYKDDPRYRQEIQEKFTKVSQKSRYVDKNY